MPRPRRKLAIALAGAAVALVALSIVSASDAGYRFTDGGLTLPQRHQGHIYLHVLGEPPELTILLALTMLGSPAMWASPGAASATGAQALWAMGEAWALVAALLAAIVYVISLALLILMLVRVLLWRLRYRRPELGTRTPDGFFSLLFGLAALAVAPLITYELIANPEATMELALALFAGTLANAFGWVQLRMSYSVALAELRYALARQRRLRARGQQRSDPVLEQEERRAEQRYRDIRYWEQER